MKKKGFTLIELLAVIVILAIIALIATPIVVTLMDKSEASAAERTAESYLKAVDIAVGTERLDGKILEGDYDILENGNLCPVGTTCTDDTDIEIDMNGQMPSSGTINIKDGVITMKTTMQIGDYIVSYDANGKFKAIKIEEEEPSEEPKDPSGEPEEPEPEPEDPEPEPEEPENTKVTVYRWSEDSIKIGDGLYSFGHTENPSSLGKIIYLKHVAENNVVTESWACAIFNGVQVCVRGGVDANGNSYYDENLSILEDLNIPGLDCKSGVVESSCSLNGVYMRLEYNGIVFVDDNERSCYIGNDGSSSCQK